MTTARSQLVCPDMTPHYHCISRCVRRSFLCGQDNYSGKSYEHRRDWVEQRILKLATIYCINIGAYAVMSNHYHLIVSIDKETAKSLSVHQIVQRWCMEHKMPSLIKQFMAGQLQDKVKLKACHILIEIWRSRLYSLSWFMKELNYTIAVQANKEDNCTGRFWEGRFKSQALLDQKALASAMAYVDLNPIRAEIADTPEQSEYTSLKLRCDSLKKGQTNTLTPLMDFAGYKQQTTAQTLPFCFTDYLELVEWLGQQIRNDNQGYVDANQPNILTRLNLSSHDCLKLATGLEQKSRLWVGSTNQLQRAKTHFNRQRVVGIHIV